MVGYRCHDTLTSIWHLQLAARLPSSNLSDQVMLHAKKKGISSNWILLAQAQEFSLQRSWVWCARNASSMAGEGRVVQGTFLGEGIRGVILLFFLLHADCRPRVRYCFRPAAAGAS